MNQPSATNGAKKSNGHGGDWYDDIINHDMELDDQPNQNSNFDQMDTEEPQGNQVEYQKLLQETLDYGRELQAEFVDDPRREVSKALSEAFSLMAYQDPLSVKEVAHLLHPNGRVAVAEELNSAILSKSCHVFLHNKLRGSSVLRKVFNSCPRAAHPTEQRPLRRDLGRRTTRRVREHQRVPPARAERVKMHQSHQSRILLGSEEGNEEVMMF